MSKKIASLHYWDRDTRSRGASVSIDASKVRLVRPRYWKLHNGKNVLGCVVEMQAGHDVREYELANTEDEVREFLNLTFPSQDLPEPSSKR